MSAMTNDEPIGVMAVRFHLPEPHEGHRYMVSSVSQRHQDMLFLLGVTRGRPSRLNPLPFEVRKQMILSAFPTLSERFTILPNPSHPSSEKRSRIIDDLIRKTFPGRQAILYGSRDSMITSYNGEFPTAEIPTIFKGSATNIRAAIKPIDSMDFRAGMIYATREHGELAYPAVDVLIRKPLTDEILLVGKEEDGGLLRFPGVFYDTKRDDSYEEAGARALSKEITGIQTSPLAIVGSKRVGDWRYQKSGDTVISLLMSTTYLGGTALPGNGVDFVRWVAAYEVHNSLVEYHKPLYELYVQKKIT